MIQHTLHGWMNGIISIVGYFTVDYKYLFVAETVCG